jgi:hypothetical protein
MRPRSATVKVGAAAFGRCVSLMARAVVPAAPGGVITTAGRSAVTGALLELE